MRNEKAAEGNMETVYKKMYKKLNEYLYKNA